MKKNIPNVTSVTLLQILCFNPLSLSLHKTKYANMTNEREIASGIFEETIKEFKRCTIQSTICDFAQYGSNKQVEAINDYDEQVYAINDSGELVDIISDPTGDPSSYSKVATYTTNRNFPQNLLRSRFVPEIIQGSISPINPFVAEDISMFQEILGSRQTVLPKTSVTDAARTGVHIFQTPRKVSHLGRYSFFISFFLSFFLSFGPASVTR